MCVYICIHACNKDGEKEVMDLKESGEKYMGQFGGATKHEKSCNYSITSICLINN